MSPRDPHVFEFGEQFDAWPSHDDTPAANVDSDEDAADAAPIAKNKPSRDTLSMTQLMRDLKARLRYVEREIKARKTLEKEREQIRRLLKAAKQEKATVHALKRTAS